MRLRSGKLLVVLALVSLTGLHWAMLQTVAWTTMLAGNLCRETFAQAVDKTFDGQHPCCLCKAIAAAKKSGKKSDAVSPALKMEFPPVIAGVTLIPPPSTAKVSPQDAFAEAVFAEPLLPPPRQFPA